jgi:hypothetical protein
MALVNFTTIPNFGADLQQVSKQVYCCDTYEHGAFLLLDLLPKRIIKIYQISCLFNYIIQ